MAESCKIDKTAEQVFSDIEGARKYIINYINHELFKASHMNIAESINGVRPKILDKIIADTVMKTGLFEGIDG